MNRVMQIALGVFVVLFIAGAVNAALITAAPGDLRAPWIVWTSTGAVALVAALVWWKAVAGRRR